MDSNIKYLGKWSADNKKWKGEERKKLISPQNSQSELDTLTHERALKD